MDLGQSPAFFRRNDVPLSRPFGEERFTVQGQSTNPRGGKSSNNSLSIDSFDLAAGRRIRQCPYSNQRKKISDRDSRRYFTAEAPWHVDDDETPTLNSGLFLYQRARARNVKHNDRIRIEPRTCSGSFLTEHLDGRWGRLSRIVESRLLAFDFLGGCAPCNDWSDSGPLTFFNTVPRMRDADHGSESPPQGFGELCRLLREHIRRPRGSIAIAKNQIVVW